jgi:hypothetical protein
VSKPVRSSFLPASLCHLTPDKEVGKHEENEQHFDDFIEHFRHGVLGRGSTFETRHPLSKVDERTRRSMSEVLIIKLLLIIIALQGAVNYCPGVCK